MYLGGWIYHQLWLQLEMQLCWQDVQHMRQ